MKTPPDWRDTIYYRYYGGQPERPAHFGIRTQEAKLIYYDGLKQVPPSLRWEFYHLRDDPHETRNRYDDPPNAAMIEQLKKRLAALQSELGDSH